MNTISFKRLKFFKSSGLQTKKQKDSVPSPKKEVSFFKRVVQSPFIFIFIFVAIVAYIVSYLPSKSLPLAAEGEIASSDIIAPNDLTIEDKETTEKESKKLWMQFSLSIASITMFS